MASHRYHVFLSHSTVDKPAVEELANRLVREGIEPWLDMWNLVPGEVCQPAMEAALADCASCAVFVGPGGFGPWQNEEMRAAIARRVHEARTVSEVRDRFRVIPVLLPSAERPEPGRLPMFLAATTWVEFRRALDDEEAFRRLVCGIRGIEPGAGLSGAAFEGACPYRGLEVFDVAHAPFFFGREALTEWLIVKLRASPSGQENRFLAILGASGSGKSSLARAGLIPAIKRGELVGSAEWPVVILKPGRDPIESLAVALAGLDGTRPSPVAVQGLMTGLQANENTLHLTTRLALRDAPPARRLVLLLDQFEEVFTLCEDEKARKALFDNLLYAATIADGQAIVVLTMRADFYGKCGPYPALAAAMSDHQLLVVPMIEDELRRAVERPALLAGGEFEPGLVEMLLQDIAGQPGFLPLLQFTLMELWGRREGRRLTVAAYRAIGGLKGALERRANEVVMNFNTAQGELCRRIFLRLTQPGEGIEYTKRRASFGELVPAGADPSAVEAVVRRLADARLITTDRLITTEGDPKKAGEVSVEVAHEALIRGWSQLREWIDADRAGLRTHRQLTEAAHEWEANRRESSFLYGGTRLVVAREWAKTHRDELNALETEFLAASRHKRLKLRLALVASMLTAVGALIAVRILFVKSRAEAQVEALATLPDNEVPGRLDALNAECLGRFWAQRHIATLLEDHQRGAQGLREPFLHRLRLARLRVDPTEARHLHPVLLAGDPSNDPREYLLLCAEFGRHAPADPSLCTALWHMATDDPSGWRRLQAACALAATGPRPEAPDRCWGRIRGDIAAQLVRTNPFFVRDWSRALDPVRAPLTPPLRAILDDPQRAAEDRSLAAMVLAEYGSDQPVILVELLTRAETEAQYQYLLHKIAALGAGDGDPARRRCAEALGQLGRAARSEPSAAPAGAVVRTSPASRDAEDRLSRSRATAAAALLQLGVPGPAWDLLAAGSDPLPRSELIHTLRPIGVPPATLATELGCRLGRAATADWTEADLAVSRALILALGEYSDAKLVAPDRERLVRRLQEVFRADPDPGLHAAAEWALRRWQASVPTLSPGRAVPPSSDRPRWYVDRSGNTLVVLPLQDQDDAFAMGTPTDERIYQNPRAPETRHSRWIPRRFAIATKEVTVAQFQEFLPGYRSWFDEDRAAHDREGQSGPRQSNEPITYVSWYRAAAFCNWLSCREGIDKDQWCYPPELEQIVAMPGVRTEDWIRLKPLSLPSDHLKRTGYRLPTEAEWEYTCRAGSSTLRFYGRDRAARLLAAYANDRAHAPLGRLQPVGDLKPNDFGLFDTLGNAAEWCQRLSPYPDSGTTLPDNDEGPWEFARMGARVLRGGSREDQAEVIRSAYRQDFIPLGETSETGFRVARTLDPGRHSDTQAR